MRDLVKCFKALSSDTRLRILNLLFQRECCVCEIMQVLEISQTRASRNLISLHDAGLIQNRRDGAWVVYNIDYSSGLSSELVELLKKRLNEYELLNYDLEKLKKTNRIVL